MLDEEKALKNSPKMKDLYKKMSFYSQLIRKFMENLMYMIFYCRIVFDKIPDDQEKNLKFKNPEFKFKVKYARLAILG